MNHSHPLGKLNRGLGTSARVLVAAAVLILFAALALFASGKADTATAASGGIGITSPKPPATGGGAAKTARFGARTLREGMTGPDVRVLKGIVRSKNLLRGTPLSENFDRPTTGAVRRFQNTSNIRQSGVVNTTTAKALVRSLGRSVATWYGPGFYGNQTACGQRLRPNTIGVAHKTLPCGSRVLIGYRGKYAIVPVIDRGPFGAGRSWDLTERVAKSVGMISAGVGNVRHAVISRAKR